jgi:hypothetical protein
VRSLVLAACAAAVLCVAPSAQAHRTGAHSGLISTVSYVDPLVPGLLVRVLDGHVRLSVANLTKQDVLIERSGGGVERVPAGRTRVWREPRVGANEKPPARDGLIRNWSVPGTIDGKPFRIVGFLGYRAPPQAATTTDDGTPTWVIALAAVGGAVLLGAALAVPLVVRRGEA